MRILEVTVTNSSQFLENPLKGRNRKNKNFIKIDILQIDIRSGSFNNHFSFLKNKISKKA